MCVCTIVDQWIDINSVSGCGVMSTKLLATFGLVSGNTLCTLGCCLDHVISSLGVCVHAHVCVTTIVSTGTGKRRYDRKQSGYGGQTKPVFHKKVIR